MISQDPDFIKRLLETFELEAHEHIENLTQGLLALETVQDASASLQQVEALFREVHSLKGAARSVNISEVEELCKALEEVFSFYKHQEQAFPNGLISAFLDAADLLKRLVGQDASERQQSKPEVQSCRQQLLALFEKLKTPPQPTIAPQNLNFSNFSNEGTQESAVASHTPDKVREQQTDEQGLSPSQQALEQTTKQAEVAEPSSELETVTPEVFGNLTTDDSEKPAVIQAAPASKQTLRVSVEKLDAILRQSEELLYAKMVSRQQVNLLNELKSLTESLSKLPVLHADAEPLLKNINRKLMQGIRQTKTDSREVGVMVDHLLDAMKRAMTLPFSTLYSSLPKTVYDMSKQVGKEARLEIIGGEVQIDRRILEEMYDPIIHLLRNAVDHGIETPEQRERYAKPIIGKVEIEVRAMGANKVEILVRDDGGGVDLDLLRQKLIALHLADEQQLSKLNQTQLLQHLFDSGVTTRSQAGELSGRGLGLAIVLEKVEKLGGQVKVSLLPGKASAIAGGCEFRIQLPITMATFRGVLTQLGEQFYIFPSDHTLRVLELEDFALKSVDGQQMLKLEHELIPFYPLHQLMGTRINLEKCQKLHIVIVSMGKNKLAIGVDQIHYEDEVIVKSLGKQLQNVKNISGAALLASNQIALVLNISDLFHSIGLSTPMLQTLQNRQETPKRKILVVDDSATTRALLQNILEISGYEVLVAKDGLEAYETLKTTPCDLVVSDVDMPKMTGIELTKSIRADSHLEKTPVILVTSLESPDDRERGMLAGADAYIIKSTFDQNNLMEKIEWLVV